MKNFKTAEHKPNPSIEVLKVSTRFGLTSFGGPIAHLSYFYNEYVRIAEGDRAIRITTSSAPCKAELLPIGSVHADGYIITYGRVL